MKKKKKLVVWAVTTHIARDGNQWRVLAAVKSRSAFAKLIGMSDHHLKNYGAETGNQKEVAMAMSKPGTVFGCQPLGTYYTTQKELIELTQKDLKGDL